MTLAEVKDKKLTCVVHTKSKAEAKMLTEYMQWENWDGHPLDHWNEYAEQTGYYIEDGKLSQFSPVRFYKAQYPNYGEVYEFSDLFPVGSIMMGGDCAYKHTESGIEKYKITETPPRYADEGIIGTFKGTPIYADGGVVSIHDLPTNEWYNPIGERRLREQMEQAKKLVTDYMKDKHIEFKNGSFIIVKDEEENNLKFTFYVKEGTRVDKTCNKLIPTMTTFVSIGRYHSGKATCDKADYSERDGILNAIANAVLGGNFDREYEKFLADKKHKYDESCKCKICGRNYYEDEKTGKRTPFTPEDARKHEEWHEQNKKNKREKYLIRKEAKRRLAEAEREGKIEQTMKEFYKK